MQHLENQGCYKLRKMVEWYKIPLSPQQSPVSRKIYRTFAFYVRFSRFPRVEFFKYLGSVDETFILYILSIISYKPYVMILTSRYSILTLLEKRKI